MAVGPRGRRASEAQLRRRSCTRVSTLRSVSGAVAQLGERLAGSQKVRGSSPLGSIGPQMKIPEGGGFAAAAERQDEQSLQWFRRGLRDCAVMSIGPLQVAAWRRCYYAHAGLSSLVPLTPTQAKPSLTASHLREVAGRDRRNDAVRPWVDARHRSVTVVRDPDRSASDGQAEADAPVGMIAVVRSLTGFTRQTARSSRLPVQIDPKPKTGLLAT